MLWLLELIHFQNKLKQNLKMHWNLSCFKNLYIFCQLLLILAVFPATFSFYLPLLLWHNFLFLAVILLIKACSHSLQIWAFCHSFAHFSSDLVLNFYVSALINFSKALSSLSIHRLLYFHRTCYFLNFIYY